MKHIFTTALSITLMLCLTACSTQPISSFTGYSDNWKTLEKQHGPGLIADPASPIPDVPAPIGFKPIPEHCNVVTDGYYRVVNHLYQGKANLAEMVQYAKTYMEAEGWQPIDRIDDLASNTSVINFRKGAENLSVRMTKRFAVASMYITIEPQNTAAMGTPLPDLSTQPVKTGSNNQNDQQILPQAVTNNQ
ncbi:hypothetical protein [Poriferisphaera sp. WC338]|uniref:hypothetical protein n=1 Tax=Poriferisphaera sp. WC338 TaxID=3425129 RepID=UPI003D8175D4